jgi:hypothetical protein
MDNELKGLAQINCSILLMSALNYQGFNRIERGKQAGYVRLPGGDPQQSSAIEKQSFHCDDHR